MRSLVHIVPLGWEFDRAVEPVLAMKAHRVYILSRTDSEENLHFIAKAKARLAGTSEPPDVRVLEIDAEREFESLLLNISQTILAEAGAANAIYLNIGASGKMAAAAATLAGMYHYSRLTLLYYAPAAEYSVLQDDSAKAFREHGLSLGSGKVVRLPQFVISEPSPAAVTALRLLYETPDLTYAELIAGLRAARVPGFEVASLPARKRRARLATEQAQINRWVAKLRRAVLDDLRALNLIESAPRTGLKVRVKLTLEGEYHALISGQVKRLRA